MAFVSTYLNFETETEQAFAFYRDVFQTDYATVMRFGDLPPMPGRPEMSDADKRLILNMQLPITGGHMLMGSDSPMHLRGKVVIGNNTWVVLNVDSQEEADRLAAALSIGGRMPMAMQHVFWGAYYGQVVDRFGVQWMITHQPPAPV